MRMPPQEYLKECFDYDPETGELRWKVRPLEHFATKRGWRSSNARFANRPALAAINSTGLRTGGFTFEGKLRIYCQHLIIWKWMTGKDPLQGVNHRDKDLLNNRWENLREASRSQWAATAGAREGKQVPFKGVHKVGDKFRATIRMGGKRFPLGQFETPELASAAYAAKATELFGQFARTI